MKFFLKLILIIILSCATSLAFELGDFLPIKPPKNPNFTPPKFSTGLNYSLSTYTDGNAKSNLNDLEISHKFIDDDDK